MLDRYGNRVHDSTATLRFRAIPASNPAQIGISTGVNGPVVFDDGLASFNLNIFETETGRGWFVSSVPKVKPAPSGVIRGPYSRSATWGGTMRA
jgi:hypothetical protein